MATGPKVSPPADKERPAARGLEFRSRLDLAETAEVIFALSEEASALLTQFSVEPLEGAHLLWKSTKLWESPIRGIVVKCNDDIVAKVLYGNNDYTEYTSMQFLAERAPDIPAPRPHGLIEFEPFHVILMSYIPDTTLTEAWSNLTYEGKLSIQQQLEDIFCRLRSLRMDEGQKPGGVRGEGVKDVRVHDRALSKDITTATEFSNFQFSAPHHGSKTYVTFLRSFLEQVETHSMHELVFTHGDVRTDNIMVTRDPSVRGHYIVTGIINWEDSGFYPAYYECTTLTRTISLVDEDDWYLHLPVSIAPSKFPTRWLVDRLWDIQLRST